MNYNNFFEIKDGWSLQIKELREDQLVHYGSNLLCGNGYLGYRGTLEEWGKEEYQACVVTDTYDMADGKWSELSNSPNALTTKVIVNGKDFGDYPKENRITTELDFNYKFGIFKRISQSKSENDLEIVASYDNLHLIINKYQINNLDKKEIQLKIGIN